MTLSDIGTVIMGLIGSLGVAYFLLQKDAKKKETELKERELAIEEAKLRLKL